MRVTIVDAGTYTTVQDGGRGGFEHLGISPSGAYDMAALKHANMAVGNDVYAPVLESLLGGLAISSADQHMVVAVSGAHGPHRVRRLGVPHDMPAPTGQQIFLNRGDILTLGIPVSGLRYYLAIRGHMSGTQHFGSVSTDTLSGLGTPVLQSGGEIVVTVPTSRFDVTATTSLPCRELSWSEGPNAALLSDGIRTLSSLKWIVSPLSDRVGIRLTTEDSWHIPSLSLPSAPTCRGSVQVTPSGELVVFGPDSPVSGGYPVVAIMEEESVDMCAQLRPGESVRVRAVCDRVGRSSV